MDNLTHSLFGAAVAETYIQRKFPKHPNVPRTALYLTSIVANSFPDLDLLLGIIDPSQLGYLLNHRGWTHTVLGALLESLLLICVLKISLFRFQPQSLSFQKDFWVLSLLGCQTHLLLDFFNSYGIHPFWPLSADWYSLDSIFIIEPLLWVSLIPLWLQPQKLSTLLALPILLAYGYGFSKNLISTPTLITASVFFLFCNLFYRRLSPIRRPHFALGLFLTLILLFWGHQKTARYRINAELAKNSTAKTLDTAMSSLPSNPRCWFFVTPQIVDTEYRVLAGTLSLYGSVETCGSWPIGSGLRANSPMPSNTQHITYRGAWASSLGELRTLLNRCDVRSWFKFARVPFWEEGTLNDLRFASRNQKNFTSYLASSDVADHCPPIPAPWAPPRRDLLDFLNIQ